MGTFAGFKSDEVFADLAAVAAAGKGFGPGDVHVTKDGKRYRFVKYNQGAGSVAAVAGNFCYYYAAGGASAGEYQEVTSDLSDSANVGAGVLQAVIPNAGYGWIQTGGYAVITPAATAGADGNAMTAVGATDGTIDVSALVTDFICAVAIDISAKKFFLTCP